ncbi:MAG: c-type cytochrome [Methylotenera sp.]
MKYTILGLFYLAMTSCTTQENASKPVVKNAAVKEKAQVCATCHDPNLKSGFAEAPPLAGRPFDELVAAIEKVRDYDATQPSLRHNLSDKDIHEIATYFSSMK